MFLSWRVVGASVQGTSHQAADVECQDAHAYTALSNGDLIVAVADGAGSAPRGQEGARLATDHIVAWLGEVLQVEYPQDRHEWVGLMAAAMREAREALYERAIQHETPVRVFSTTLTCAVATAECLVVGHIGDGVAIIKDAMGHYEVVARPQRGEYANEAAFLTMPNALDYIEVALLSQSIEALALSTDGLLRLATKLPNFDPFPPFFRPLFDFTTQAEDLSQAEIALAQFLASERVCQRTDDDKTLVLAARVVVPAPAPRLESPLDGQVSSRDGHAQDGSGVETPKAKKPRRRRSRSPQTAVVEGDR